MHPYCFFNGKITKTNKPLLYVNDIAVLRGFAAFDFLRIYNKNPFQFEDHMKRFRNTAKPMGLKLKITNTQIREILDILIQKNKQKDYHVRFVLTGGDTREGINPDDPVFYILFEKMADIPKKYYTKGAKIITHEHQRTLPSAKNSNYMQAVLLQKQKNKADAIEVLYIQNKKILEATTSNIFIIKNKALYTPKDNVLCGITRKLIFILAQKLKIKVIEKDISLKDIYCSDEVFLTATNKKVLPIVQVDNKNINNKKVGEITKSLLYEYEKLIPK